MNRTDIFQTIGFWGIVVSIVFIPSMLQAQNFAGEQIPQDTSSESMMMAEEDSTNTNINEEKIDEKAFEETLKNLPVYSASDLTPEQLSKYTLGPTDVIAISVMRHSEVSGEFLINMEGKIQYGFVGDIQVSGLTKQEATELIKQQLSEYIVNPEVTITITGYNSKIVYVVGEVGRPGKIFMHGDTISVREALMGSGLPQLTAKARKSRLITPTDDGKPTIKDVDVYALLYEGDLRENLIMNPGDTLYIPPTALTSIMRAISPVSAPLGAGAGVGRTVTTGF